MRGFIILTPAHNTREKIDIGKIRSISIRNHRQSTACAILTIKQNHRCQTPNPIGEIRATYQLPIGRSVLITSKFENCSAYVEIGETGEGDGYAVVTFE